MKILFYLIKLRYVVRGHNTVVKQVNDRGLKILQRCAVMNPSLIQNQVQQEQSILLQPYYR